VIVAALPGVFSKDASPLFNTVLNFY